MSLDLQLVTEMIGYDIIQVLTSMMYTTVLDNTSLSTIEIVCSNSIFK